MCGNNNNKIITIRDPLETIIGTVDGVLDTRSTPC